MAGCLLGFFQIGGRWLNFSNILFRNILKWTYKIYLMADRRQQVKLKNSLKRHLLSIKKCISFKYERYERLNKLNQVIKAIGHTSVLWILPKLYELFKFCRRNPLDVYMYIYRPAPYYYLGNFIVHSEKRQVDRKLW